MVRAGLAVLSGLGCFALACIAAAPPAAPATSTTVTIGVAQEIHAGPDAQGNYDVSFVVALRWADGTPVTRARVSAVAATGSALRTANFRAATPPGTYEGTFTLPPGVWAIAISSARVRRPPGDPASVLVTSYVGVVPTTTTTTTTTTSTLPPPTTTVLESGPPATEGPPVQLSTGGSGDANSGGSVVVEGLSSSGPNDGGASALQPPTTDVPTTFDDTGTTLFTVPALPVPVARHIAVPSAATHVAAAPTVHIANAGIDATLVSGVAVAAFVALAAFGGAWMLGRRRLAVVADDVLEPLPGAEPGEDRHGK